jgi:hypothetical protein
MTRGPVAATSTGTFAWRDGSQANALAPAVAASSSWSMGGATV